MGRKSFQNYSKKAQSNVDYTTMSGRYTFQKDSEVFIIEDICKKLEITAQDNLLEIGCGPGNLLGPLSSMVKFSTGIDSKEMLDKLHHRFPKSKIKSFPGNFLDQEISHKFNKILIYSVLHYLRNQAEVLLFINKALSLLNSGGRLLIGDLPNSDYKKRVMNTQFGKKFTISWNDKLARNSDIQLDENGLDGELVDFTDNLVLRIIDEFRSKNYNTFLLPQNNQLPFGFTREDILIIKSEK